MAGIVGNQLQVLAQRIDRRIQLAVDKLVECTKAPVFQRAAQAGHRRIGGWARLQGLLQQGSGLGVQFMLLKPGPLGFSRGTHLVQGRQAIVPANPAITLAQGSVDQITPIGVGQALDPVHAGQHIVLHCMQRLACEVLADRVRHQQQRAGQQEQAEQAKQLVAEVELQWIESHRRRAYTGLRQRPIACCNSLPGTGLLIR